MITLGSPDILLLQSMSENLPDVPTAEPAAAAGISLPEVPSKEPGETIIEVQTDKPCGWVQGICMLPFGSPPPFLFFGITLGRIEVCL